MCGTKVQAFCLVTAAAIMESNRIKDQWSRKWFDNLDPVA
jgi:hypothetical protein